MLLRRATLALLACAVWVGPAFAKRGPPPEIEPIVLQGVRYVVPNDDGRRAIVKAVGISSGKTLWEVEVFRVAILPDLEEDVQWVFLAKMTAADGKLHLVAEDGRRFLLDPADRTVTVEK